MVELDAYWSIRPNKEILVQYGLKPGFLGFSDSLLNIIGEFKWALSDIYLQYTFYNGWMITREYNFLAKMLVVTFSSLLEPSTESPT